MEVNVKVLPGELEGDLTVWYVQGYSSSDEERYNLYRVTNGFEFRCSCCGEALRFPLAQGIRLDDGEGSPYQIFDDDRRERIHHSIRNCSSEHRNEEQDCFRINKCNQTLLLHELLILDPRFVSGYALHGNEALSFVQESCV